MVDFFLIFVNALRQCKMRSKNCNFLFIYLFNLEPRVLWLFGQRVGARRDSNLRIGKNINFLIGCSETACIVLPRKSCVNKIPLPQSLYWRPPADQKARGLWVRGWPLF